MRPGMGPDGTIGRSPLGQVGQGGQEPHWQDEGPANNQGEEDNFGPNDEEPQLPDEELEGQPYE